MIHPQGILGVYLYGSWANEESADDEIALAKAVAESGYGIYTAQSY